MKKIRYAWLLVVVLAPSALGAIYKTVDEKGNVVYTDVKPAEQAAEEVKLRAITPLEVNKPSSRPPAPTTLPTKIKYTEFEISEPANDATIHNSGNFNVKIAMTPPLQPAHSIRLRLNGEIKSPAKRTLDIALLNIERGTHTLTAEILDGDDDVIKSASSVVHVKRAIYRPPPNTATP